MIKLADAIDRAFQKLKDGDSLSKNEQFELERLNKEKSQRGSDYKAWKNNNAK